MYIFNNAISPEDSFEVEKTITYLVNNYNKSGHNPKPVILHSLRIAMILLEMGYSKKIVVAAILHDIVEDTDITLEQLSEDFDEEICILVNAVSYDESISSPIMQYKDMFNRIIGIGRDAVILKCIDISVNSLYINLVPDRDKQKELIRKGAYFLELTKDFSDEPAWKLLKSRNLEESKRIMKE